MSRKLTICTEQHYQRDELGMQGMPEENAYLWKVHPSKLLTLHFAKAGQRDGEPLVKLPILKLDYVINFSFNCKYNRIDKVSEIFKHDE